MMVFVYVWCWFCEFDCCEKVLVFGMFGLLVCDCVFWRCVMNWIGMWCN